MGCVLHGIEYYRRCTAFPGRAIHAGTSKHGFHFLPTFGLAEYLIEGFRQVRCCPCPSSGRRFLLGREGFSCGPKGFTGALTSHKTAEPIVPVRPLRTLVGQVQAMAAGEAPPTGRTVQLSHTPTAFPTVGCARAGEEVARSAEVGPGALQTDGFLYGVLQAPLTRNLVGEHEQGSTVIAHLRREAYGRHPLARLRYRWPQRLGDRLRVLEVDAPSNPGDANRPAPLDGSFLSVVGPASAAGAAHSAEPPFLLNH